MSYVPSAPVVVAFTPAVTRTPETPVPVSGSVTSPVSSPYGPVVNAAVPSGVPRPVGPSQPVRAEHRYAVSQVPLVPVTTSLRAPVPALVAAPAWAYG